MAKGRVPKAFKANAAAMKAGKPLKKSSGGSVPPKNISKRRKSK